MSTIIVTTTIAAVIAMPLAIIIKALLELRLHRAQVARQLALTDELADRERGWAL